MSGGSASYRCCVSALVVSGTNLYAGGDFTTAGGVAANNIAKWDGNSWSALGTGVAGYYDSQGDYRGPCVAALAMSGTNLFAGGCFTNAGGELANHIAKWDGTAWSQLALGLNSYAVCALAVSDTNLYVGGWFTYATNTGPSAVLVKGIAKWNGSSWSALGSGVSGFVVRALVVSGSDLYVGGSFTSAGGVSAKNVAKWNGNSWSALGSGVSGGENYAGYDGVSALTVSGNDLYVGGWFTNAGGLLAINIAKWTGSAWSALGAGMNGGVQSLVVLGTNLYAGGWFNSAGGGSASCIAKWNGSAWSGTSPGLNSVVYSLAVSGTNLYAGGEVGLMPANCVAKWEGTGWSALGSGIGSDEYAQVLALAVLGTDLYAGGFFTKAGGVTAKGIAKWDGSNWSGLGLGMAGGQDYDAIVLALAVAGTNLYVGGSFTRATNSGGGVVTVNGIAKWDGSSWSALGTNWFHLVNALAVSGSNLYAAVSWGTSYVSKWNGSSWSALGSGMNNGVSALAVSGSDVYAGGRFTLAGGVSANNVAKWNGSSWTALGSGMNSDVTAMAVSGSDLYAGGSFTTAGGVSVNKIAKWNGSSWSALGSGMNSDVTAMAVSGGDLYVGGYFTTAGGNVSAYVAKADIRSPEMDVFGNGNEIADGDGTPVLADHTDFGTAGLGSSTVVRTFTITNSGTADLNLSGTPKVVVSGTHATDFTVTLQPTSPVAANHSTIFQVTFAPASTGVRTATLSIINDDDGENSYDFAIQGTGEKSPATVTLGNLTQNYDGTAKSATATTTPSGLAVDFTYNGSPNAPTNVGLYTVVGTINDASYYGSAINAFAINPAGCPTITLSPATLPGYPSRSGLVAYYPFDGNANDASGNGYHGVISNAVLCPDINGSPNSAMRFNGTDAVIDCGDVINNFSNFTMAAWIKIRARVNPGWDGFISEGSNLDIDGNWQFHVGADGTKAFGSSFYWLNGGGYCNTRVVHSLPLDSWHHIVQTYDGAYVRQYDNGEMVNAVSYPGKGMGTSSPMYLGRAVFMHNSIVPFDGDIDEVCIYNRALSSREIALLIGTNSFFLGYNFYQNISASGGMVPYTYAVTSGSLPNGLSLATNGSLTGALLALGTNTFTVTATDANGCTGSATYTLAIPPSGPVETNKPSVAIKSPVNKATTNTAAITVSGTAADANGVALLFYAVNGGAQQLADTANQFKNWTASVMLNPGTNTFTAQSVDYCGNASKPVTNTYFLAVPSLLTVLTDGSGWFTPTNYNSTNLSFGRSYSVTAYPGTNWLFTNWTASVSGGAPYIATNAAKLTFLMQSNLTLTANFVTNRFIGAAGIYWGLFSDNPVAHQSAGLFKFKPTSKQAYSGSLYLDGNTLSLSGKLNLDGYGSNYVTTRKGKAALFVEVQLRFDGSDSVIGTVHCLSNTPYALDGPFTATMLGYKEGFNATNPTTAGTLAGLYNMAVDVPTDPVSPKGHGYLTITVKTNGQVSASGKLGDYATLTPTTVGISRDGDWPLYASAYSAPFVYYDTKLALWKTNKEYQGSIMGWLKFTNNPARELLDSAGPAGGVHWIKKQVASTNRFYPDGFTNWNLTVWGSAYVAPTNVATDPALKISSGYVTNLDGNLDPGGFANAFSQTVANKIVITPPNVNTQAITMSTTKGTFTTTFYNSNALRKVTGTGVVLQDEQTGRGVFLGTNASGSFLLQSD